MDFASLGLSAPILDAVAAHGYTTPSPIQAQAIPAVLTGQDVMAAAQTGTGKTAGFTLPLLERLSQGKRAQSNQARALVLTPTRELAAQIGESVATYGKNLPLRSTVVFGGVKINPQMQKLRQGVDILVATPGRLLDLHNQNAVHFPHLEVLILDEADRMLDMGFIHDIRKIIALLPNQRQNLMFSATFSDSIRKLAKGLVHNPVEISVSPPNSTAQSVTQWLCPVDKKQKSALLTHLIKEHDWHQVLVFSKTKHGANRLAKYLDERGINAAAIHGNKSQGARTKALAGFKAGKIRILVATDIAARGLDIDQLPQVVNFDLPNVAEDYVHRIGRTGRAGASGQAVSLVSADEHKDLMGIERLIKQLIERRMIDDFEPEHSLPESKLDTRPYKAPKPKKPKREHHQGQRSGDAARGHKPPGKNKQHTGPKHNARNANSRDGNGAGNSHGNNNSNNRGRTNAKPGSKPNGQRRASANGNVNGNVKHNGNRANQPQRERNGNR